MSIDHAMRWDRLSPFDRMALLRSLLDGSADERQVNLAVWRGLGLVPKDEAVDPTVCANALFPDVFSDAALVADMEAKLPTDDDDEMATLDIVVETLHGAEMTRMLLQEGDADFAVRRSIVRWLHFTQPELGF